MNKLSQRDEHILHLKNNEGKTVNEIAEMMKMEMMAIYQVLSRARQKGFDRGLDKIKSHD